MFTKLLIANRGEIACRIIRTARLLGIPTVAVYSESDRHALHTQLADEAYYIGKSPATDSYLNKDVLIQTALQAGAEAIHPGYGFLSENPEFAQRCLDANLIFIGPSPAAIRCMGLKSEAKALVSKANIAVIPGYFESDQSFDRLFKEANQLGYPLLIKASGGGGGKGMRVVKAAKEFEEALKACQREAKASFGNADVILEKYLHHPRHIEVQIVADNHGNTVHLFERDCSIQRRHQKVIEEAPANGLSKSLRTRLGEAAIQVATAIQYQNAGTIEFLLDDDNHFYFMEMNTRLQVEHPVTEMITGLDIVALQLQIARGLPLPVKQSQITHRGHAIEARICAEDPNKQFLPATGRLEKIQFPPLSDDIRLDSGVVQGDSIGIYYDSLLAKLIVWGKNRTEAVERFQQALDNFHILGITHNLPFLRALSRHPAFMQAKTNTHFIEEHQEFIISSQTLNTQNAHCLIAAAYTLFKRAEANEISHTLLGTSEPNSPWHKREHWRLNSKHREAFQFCIQDTNITVIELDENTICLPDNVTVRIQSTQINETHLQIQIDEGPTETFFYLSTNSAQYLYWKGQEYVFTLAKTNEFSKVLDTEKTHRLTAPMPGTLSKIYVNTKDTVAMGDTLLILEAMKMEHAIKAPRAGKIARLNYKLGDTVEMGSELLTLEPLHDNA